MPLTQKQKSRIGLPELEKTFETIVDAFVFFDKDRDANDIGYKARIQVSLPYLGQIISVSIKFNTNREINQ